MVSYNRILLDNAYEAWYQAIKYARKIKAGLVSLQYRKAFISNLHNAIELFLKQIMIDQNDHRVTSVKFDKLDALGEPLKGYYNNNNLNQFFAIIPVDQRKKFFSIEFKDLIALHKTILNGFLSSGQSYTTELNLLKKYRNDETHFFISSQDFLNEQDYVLLHNFMIDFNNVLVYYDLVPLLNKPFIDDNGLSFVDIKLNSDFSYKNVLLNSNGIKIISETINGELIENNSCSLYLLADFFKYVDKDNKLNFEDAYGYIQSMFDYNILDFEPYIVEAEYPYEGYSPQCRGYYVVINL